MENTVKRIRPADYELSVVQDNLANAIQEILDSIRGQSSASLDQIALKPLLQRLRGPGTPQTIQTPALLVRGDSSNSGGDTVIIGEAATKFTPQVDANVSVAGRVNIQGPVTTTGSANFNGMARATGPGNVFSIKVTENNPNGVAAFVEDFQGKVTWILYQTGAMVSQGAQTAPSFVSGVGFKSLLTMGTFWYPNYPGGIVFTQDVIRQIGALGAASTMVYRATMASAGSVTGITVALEAGVNAKMQAGVYKNGAQIYYGDIAAINQTRGIIKFTKGQLPFVANDVLTCGFGFSAAGINTSGRINFEIELGA